ncbi:MAG TPA: hypothetical protein VK900_03160 [Anaerolineales bacterium]|nr:hypothetical protein [Anaerolineales bacterium]
MTKVTLHPALVQYRQDMAEMVHQIRRENRLAGVAPAPARRDVVSSDPCLAGLLKPPRIERLDLCILDRGARLDGYIHVNTSDEFGVMEVHVSLTDERGKHIESGYAMRNEYWPGHWGYMPRAHVPSGSSITVHAVARDHLGGVGMRSASTTCRP